MYLNKRIVKLLLQKRVQLLNDLHKSYDAFQKHFVCFRPIKVKKGICNFEIVNTYIQFAITRVDCDFHLDILRNLFYGDTTTYVCTCCKTARDVFR